MTAIPALKQRRNINIASHGGTRDLFRAVTLPYKSPGMPVYRRGR